MSNLRVDWSVKLSPHLWIEECRCKDGSLPSSFPETIKPVLWLFEVIRSKMNAVIEARHGRFFDEGITVTSGYRSPAYNGKLPSNRGKKIKTGAHPAGTALDTHPSNGYRLITYEDYYACVVDSCVDFKEPYRVGKYTKSGFVHVDCWYGHGSRRWGR